MARVTDNRVRCRRCELARRTHDIANRKASWNYGMPRRVSMASIDDYVRCIEDATEIRCVRAQLRSANIVTFALVTGFGTFCVHGLQPLYLRRSKINETRNSMLMHAGGDHHGCDDLCASPRAAPVFAALTGNRKYRHPFGDFNLCRVDNSELIREISSFFKFETVANGVRVQWRIMIWLYIYIYIFGQLATTLNETKLSILRVL